MTLNGKRDDFDRSDVAALASTADLTTNEGLKILDNVRDVVSEWRSFAADAGAPKEMAEAIQSTLRVDL